tara:strand:- start:155 stop:403 length:249 start_codon:yes stop_codon:yes gene_type:complete
VTNSSALLGPIITGAKTGSVYQATLSFGSGKIISEFKKNQVFSKSLSFQSDLTSTEKEPHILLTYAVDKIKISEVLEPEPLP